ncbi:MAG: hypothetical protein OSA45_11205 [Halioglobus sp.]|nr:hypothetical protein [Halioglobus sp.]
MKSILDVIFPKTVNNEYQGGAIVFYGFCLLVARGFFSSCAHLFLPDGGINSIASVIVFEGLPNPNDVIYMLQAGGGVFQLSFALLNALVLWRYRSLIPLMLAFLLLQQSLLCMVHFMHPLTSAHYEYEPPAIANMYPLLIVEAILLFIAVRKSKAH